MVLTGRLSQWLHSTRTWIALGVLAPIGMLVISGMMLLDLRRDTWDRSEQASKSLLQVLEHDISRNIEIIDLILLAVVDNLKIPGVAEAPPELRRLILFNRASTARNLGVVLVLDENGDAVIDASSLEPRTLNNADREYFKAHRADGDLGLLMSGPLVSRLTGSRIVVLSRRINKPDGTFGGIVLGSLELTYFSRLFDQVGLGQNDAISLYLRDGTRLMRHSHGDSGIGANIADTPNFRTFLRERDGSFVGTSVRDGVERNYVFTQVGEWLLVLVVSPSTATIEAAWRSKALIISGIVLALCGLTAFLSLLYGRDVRRRVALQAELAELSYTDALTRLPNRRRFEEVMDRVWAAARRTDRPFSLLIVDADHFKRCNDRYGHAVGDEVLKQLADCLRASVHRPDDLVARIGGEEFVILLPETDRDGALCVADKLHAAIAALSVPASGIGAGAITVSVGLAVGPAEAASPNDLFERADAALYAAKAGGRNQTRCAPAETSAVAARRSLGA